MSDKTLKSYYVGDPEKPLKRGRNKDGYVQCLLWLLITDYSNDWGLRAGPGGSPIFKIKNVKDGREKLHKYAIDHLNDMKIKCEDKLKRINDALEKLGDDPANLEKFEGKYE